MNRKQVSDSIGKTELSFDVSWLSKDPRMLHIRELAEKLARVDVPVLVTGESGTGKEVMSRFIHERSLRRNEPFIAVNCAALPSELVESELFGFEKGAFSGAHALKPGAFELADKGTLFLDEIGEMPIQVQSKLLRAVEHHQFRRIGGKTEVKVDIRILAATNQTVREKIHKKEFREDLFYRLSVAEIDLPPLRDRKEDISFLANYFLQQFCRKYRRNGIRFSAKVLEDYQGYSWPGNVRELRNVIERCVLFTEQMEIDQSFLPAFAEGHTPTSESQLPHTEEANGIMGQGLRFIDFSRSSKGLSRENGQMLPNAENGNTGRVVSNGHASHFESLISLPVGASLEEAEQILIQKTLASVGNNKSEAARILGCSRKTLHNKIHRSG